MYATGVGSGLVPGRVWRESRKPAGDEPRPYGFKVIPQRRHQAQNDAWWHLGIERASVGCYAPSGSSESAKWLARTGLSNSSRSMSKSSVSQ